MATVLESLGFVVRTNQPYEDVEEGKVREIGVMAHWRLTSQLEGKLNLHIDVLCECKNKPGPFIFITRSKNKSDASLTPQEYRFPVESYYTDRPSAGRPIPMIGAFHYFDLKKHHYYFTQDWKAVQFCSIVRTGKDWSTNDEIHNSFFYPIVKAFIARRRDLQTISKGVKGDLEWARVVLHFPLVVVTGELYRLDSEVSPERIERVSHVTAERHLRIKGLGTPGLPSRYHTYLVDFVTAQGLEEFLRTNVLGFARNVSDAMASRPDAFVRDPFASR